VSWHIYTVRGTTHSLSGLATGTEEKIRARTDQEARDKAKARHYNLSGVTVSIKEGGAHDN